MIRRASKVSESVTANFKGGKGSVLSREILEANEMGGHGRKFGYTVLEPGSSVGTHTHAGDSETYYILKGTGLYNDNGNLVTVGPGDMAFCPDGESHGLENNGTEPLVFIALILYTGMKA